jgi:hypothetical protein
MKELIEICAALKTLERNACALATVIHVEGSAYRRPGARMLMTPAGQVWGMVSGGCLEHDVLDQGRRALESNQSRIVRYDSTSEDDLLFGTGLGCNGVIDVLVEPVTPRLRELLLRAIESCCATRRPSVLATGIDGSGVFTSDQHVLLTDGGWTGTHTLLSVMEGRLPATESPVLLSGEIRGILGRVFVQLLLPPLQFAARDLETPQDLADFQSPPGERLSDINIAPPPNPSHGSNPSAAGN